MLPVAMLSITKIASNRASNSLGDLAETGAALCRSDNTGRPGYRYRHHCRKAQGSGLHGIHNEAGPDTGEEEPHSDNIVRFDN